LSKGGGLKRLESCESYKSPKLEDTKSVPPWAWGGSQDKPSLGREWGKKRIKSCKRGALNLGKTTQSGEG